MVLALEALMLELGMPDRQHKAIRKSSDKQRRESSTVTMELQQEAAWKVCVGTLRI